MATGFQDNIDSAFEVESIRKEKEAAVAEVREWLAELDAASKKANKLTFKFGTQSSLSSLEELRTQSEKFTREQTLNMKRIADAEKSVSKSKLDSARADKEKAAELKNLIMVYEKLLKMKEREERNNKKLTSEYEKLKLRYRELSDEALHLGAVHGANDPRFISAAQKAHALHEELYALEIAIGRGQRKVGQYNMVAQSFNQILRESPNAALGMRTLLISLTNNITYLFESIQQAVKAGASFKSILGVMGRQLFGVVGIVNAAIIAITYFGLEALDAAKSTEELKDENESLLKTLVDVIQAERELAELRRDNTDSGSAADAKRRIDILKAQGATELEIFEAQRRYHTIKIQDLKDEADTYKLIQDETDRYIKHFKTSFSTLKEEELDKLIVPKLAERLKELTTVTGEEAEKQAAALLAAYREGDKDLGDIGKDRLKAEMELRDEQKELAVLNIEFQKKLNEDLKKEEEDLRKEDKKKYEEYLKEKKRLYEKWQAEQISNYKEQYNTQKYQLDLEVSAYEDVVTNEQYSTDQRYAALEEYMKRRAVAIVESYEFEKNSKGKTDVEIVELEKQKQLALKALMQDGLDLEAQISQDSLRQEREAAALIKSNLEGLSDHYTKLYEERKKQEEELRKKQIENIESWISGLQKAAQIYAQLSATNSKIAKDRIEREGDDLDREEQRERDRINRTVENKAEKEQQIVDLEARTDARRQELRQKEAEEEKRQAEFQKQLAIFNIYANMYQAVGKEFGSKGVGGFATGTAIISYMTALLATLAILSVPAYGEGTTDHPQDGPAWVGEKKVRGKYRPEWVKEPGKNPYLVTKPTLLPMLKKHSEVTPVYDFDEHTDLSSPLSVNQVMLAGGGDMNKTNDLLNKLIETTENKPVSTVTFERGAIKETVIRGNTRISKLNKTHLS